MDIVPSRRNPFPGTDRFEILGELGVGGSSIVYEALDREHGARVALKALRSIKAYDLVGFKNEFRALQDVQHPGLVTLGELFEEDGQWFYTMELIDGVDFLAYVRPGSHWTRLESEPRRINRVDLRRLRAALGELVQALSALHSAGIVHRDIKPSNILVTPAGRVTLLDFGVAGRIHQRQAGSDGYVLGTAAYMAPEQGTAEPIVAAADMYAVGVLLYRAITGRLPISGAPVEILEAKLRRQAFAPSLLMPNVPRDLDELCVALTQRNPAARPSASEVLRVLQLADPVSATRIGRDASVSFLGRWRELGELHQAYAKARTGCPVAVHIIGESGIGKSFLMRHTVAQMRQRDDSAIVLAGRCYERESIAFKAFDGVVDSLCEYLLTLSPGELEALVPPSAGLLPEVFPVLRQVAGLGRAIASPRGSAIDPRETRARVFEALRALLARLAAAHPVIVMIDDLQWADHDSLALLDGLMRGPEPPALLLITTTMVMERDKSGSIPGTLADLPRSQVLELGPLRADEAEALAESLIGQSSVGSQVSSQLIAMEGGGHPMLIAELVRYSIAMGSVGERSIRVEDALWARITALDEVSRRLLALVAAAGGPVTHEALVAAMADELGDTSKAIARLRGQHLVRTTGSGRNDVVELYHYKVRKAVLDRLDSTAVMGLQENLARALETIGHGDHDVLAMLWHSSGEVTKALHYTLLAAAHAEENLAFERAAKLYCFALELSGDDGAIPKWQLRQRLGDAFTNAGRGAEAAAVYLDASAEAPAGQALELQRSGALQLLISGHIERGLAELAAVLDAVGLELPESPQRALAQLAWYRARLRLRGLRFRERNESEIAPQVLRRLDICWSVSLGLCLVDTMRAAAFQARYLYLALEAGEPDRIARGLAQEAGFSATAGTRNRRRTAKLLGMAEELAERTRNPYAIALVLCHRSMVAYLEGRFQVARDLAQPAERILRDQCTGTTWELDNVHTLGLSGLYFLGEIAEMTRRHTLFLREARERGDLFLDTCLRVSHANLVWLVRDEPEQALAAQRQAAEQWPSAGFHVQHYWLLMARVNIALYTGDGRSAYEAIRARWPALTRSMLLQVQLLRLEALYLRGRTALAIATSEQKSLVNAALADARRIRRVGVAHGLPYALTLEAGASALQGHRWRAVDLYTQAAAAADAVDMVLWATIARRAGAALQGRNGQRDKEAADRWLAGQGVVAPARFAGIFAPQE